MDIVLEGKASCSSFIECQKLEDSLRELEVDLLASELLVHRGKGFCLVLDVGLLGLVQMDLEQAGAVQSDPEITNNRWRQSYWATICLPSILPDSLANNLGGVDKVIKDSSVHGLQSPGPGHNVIIIIRIGNFQQESFKKMFHNWVSKE